MLLHGALLLASCCLELDPLGISWEATWASIGEGKMFFWLATRARIAGSDVRASFTGVVGVVALVDVVDDAAHGEGLK